MAEPTYIERSTLGTRVLALEGYWLKVYGRWGMKRIDTRFDLRSANPDFQLVTLRLWRGIVAVIVMALVPTLVIFSIPERFIPDPVLGVVMEICAVFWLAVGVWRSGRYLPRIDFVRLRTKRGGVLLDIVKDRNAPADYTTFLEDLRARIKTSAIQ